MNSRFETKGHFRVDHESGSLWSLHFKHSHWWKGGGSPSCFTLHLRDQPSMWMQDGCKVYMDAYMASNGSCFMLNLTTLNNHLSKVGLTKNRETMALRTLTTVDLLYFEHFWRPTWIEIHWIVFGWGFNPIWLHTTLEGPWLHYMNLEVCWDGLLDTFVWALTISWSRLLAHVWSDPKSMVSSA